MGDLHGGRKGGTMGLAMGVFSSPRARSVPAHAREV